MTVLVHATATSITDPFSNGLVIESCPTAFDKFQEPNCAAAIWQRELLPEFQRWIDRLPADQLPEGRLVLKPHSVFDAVRQLCDIVEMPAAAERSVLINDISTLAELFAKVMKSPYLRLRLEKVKDNACAKFHTDQLTARLVCTYRGAGTQYGFVSDGSRPATVHSVPLGSPILMRGKLWPETPKSDFAHRSPPIEGTGQTRLVLTLDPVDEP